MTEPLSYALYAYCSQRGIRRSGPVAQTLIGLSADRVVGQRNEIVAADDDQLLRGHAFTRRTRALLRFLVIRFERRQSGLQPMPPLAVAIRWPAGRHLPTAQIWNRDEGDYSSFRL